MPSRFQFENYEYKAENGVAYGRRRGMSWKKFSLADIAELSLDHPVWLWLKSLGFRRDGARTREEDNARTKMTIRPSEQTLFDIGTLAEQWGVSRTEAIARAVAIALRDGPGSKES